jgi:acyl-CoA synthetase
VGLHPAERIRAYREKGYWTDDMIDALLRERVRQFGDIPAITDPLNRDALLDGPFRTLTWPQLDDQVSRLAQVLLAEGIGTGDVVGVQLPNTVEIVIAFLAAVRIGAIVTPFPVQYRAWELTQLSNVAQVRAFLTASRIGQRPAAAELDGLRPQIPSLRWVGVFGSGLDERIAAAGNRAGLAAHLAGFSPDPNDCVTICWTSGTESTPKGCREPTTTGWPCARARWKART